MFMIQAELKIYNNTAVVAIPIPVVETRPVVASRPIATTPAAEQKLVSLPSGITSLVQGVRAHGSTTQKSPPSCENGQPAYFTVAHNGPHFVDTPPLLEKKLHSNDRDNQKVYQPIFNKFLF